MQASRDPIDVVARYYEGLVREHGPTPRGVDWTCEPTQKLRFVQLLKLVGRRRRLSLNDLGCGYGALLPFVRERLGEGVDYTGADVAPAMIAQARELWRHDPRARFECSAFLPRVADYTVASGLFNVQLGFSDDIWRAFVQDVLHELRRASRVGFAVNFIEPPRAGIEPLEGLYRSPPEPWATYCRETFAADVDVLQGYGLREFTLLVRLPPAQRGAGG